MKALWEKYAQRVDALSLRERVFLLMSVLVVLLAVVDTIWLSPAQSAQRQLVQRFGAQTQELNRLRTELQTSGQVPDAGMQLRNDIAATNAQLDEVNRRIQEASRAGDTGLELETVLVQFLRRQEGLTLVNTETLKDELPGTPAALLAQAQGGASMSRKGLQLRIAGTYPRLVQYVRTLETAMPHLRWGPLRLKSDQQTTELTLQVYLVEVQP